MALTPIIFRDERWVRGSSRRCSCGTKRWRPRPGLGGAGRAGDPGGAMAGPAEGRPAPDGQIPSRRPGGPPIRGMEGRPPQGAQTDAPGLERLDRRPTAHGPRSVCQPIRRTMAAGQGGAEQIVTVDPASGPLVTGFAGSGLAGLGDGRFGARGFPFSVFRPHEKRSAFLLGRSKEGACFLP